MTKNFYITTPIYYVNDSPHIGHAYTTIACDVMARFMRLSGYDVKFLTGTDEHGQKVDKAATKAGIDPQAFTDEVSQRFRHLVVSGDNILNVTNDDFIRTTEERHKAAAQDLWKRIEASGNIYLDKYAGWYSVRDEAFYQESELVEGKAPTGADVEWMEEESYFFKLSEFEDKLLAFYKENPGFITPKSRYNEVVSFVKGGLRDLSISRTSFNWGVPVPGQVEGDNSEQGQSKKSHVMYVWIDALTNYLTATGYPDMDSEGYKKYWADGEISPVHIVGKDILRFHAVYWPAFLMAADLPLPKKIVAHGWWTIEGEKMSKSLGNVFSPDEIITKAGGVDQLRYYMMRAMPFGNDGDFSEARMIDVVNSDLANNIGNLAQRTLSMIQKNCDGKVPECGELGDEDLAITAKANAGYKQVKLLLTEDEDMDFSEVIKVILSCSSAANEYIDTQAPWKLKKENPERMSTVLYVLAEAIRGVAILLQPFCPTAAGKLLDQLAVPEGERTFACLTEEYALKSGAELPKPEGVFPRIENKEKAA